MVNTQVGNMAESYPKTEMDLKLRELDTKIETNHRETMSELTQHRETHEKTLDQVKITNGRVKALEIWKAFLAGGLAILSLIVVPLLLLVVKDVL